MRREADSTEKCSRTFSRPLSLTRCQSGFSVQSRTTASCNGGGIAGDHRIVFVDQVHALGRDGAHDTWNAVCHALVDLPLDSGSESKRRDGDPGLVENRLEVLHVTQNPDVLAGERADLCRRVRADDDEYQLGQPRDDQGQNLLDEINHGVDVGQVAECADEKNMLTLLKSRRLVAGNLHDGREQADFESGTFGLEDYFFGRAHH